MSFSNIAFELIIGIIVVKNLQKTLNTKVNYPNWNIVLNYIFIASIILLVSVVAFPAAKPVTGWLIHLLMIFLMYIMYTERIFQPSRQLLLAIAPFFILSIADDLVKIAGPGNLTALKSILGTGIGFSIVWMIAMYFIIRKQNKNLEKEKEKTQEEAEQKALLASMKDELEVQVQQRTAELTRQKEELEHTLEELKSTQAQLIHSEKMASLGELTAGIAHEIQNPLNFINNFSDINAELISELDAELQKPESERDKQNQEDLINDIKANEEKINHHGRRADAIVKGMLQHSRKSTGQKEPTDINALCDEYLRLSYHGLRAKDKTFNATLNTDFDPLMEKINVIPQDIGRVLLNLLNNAFYAIHDKQRTAPQTFEPTVWVSTKQFEDHVEIVIKDNGKGIPQNIIDKIFQPFFTTKPTGEGTGLGLSLSYDIIKAHNGELSVNTKEGEETNFKISLPR